ncbi:hypothetical protein DAI18_12945 [Microvirgula aerodenitrificans]|uniref:HAF repeat-containing protein n=1 Tax=Microvirgula aerodenitrificans TaxID=57480 RepID=A0A2S0PBS9_9NEIS|nr:hypothetical protein [Microvirgula aerodenitrificans]AVY94844.1 hypothetical protein DAI18_12945 [Microvirgula aerodenitrificans]
MTLRLFLARSWPLWLLAGCASMSSAPQAPVEFCAPARPERAAVPPLPLVLTAMSADGSTLAGYARVTDGRRAFTWSDGDGWRWLDRQYGHVLALSADGRVAVGGYRQTAACVGPAIWVDGVRVALELPAGTCMGEAVAVSDDGSVVAGSLAPNDQYPRAFVARRTGRGYSLRLLSSPPGYAAASAVSADGRVVAGQAADSGGWQQAFVLRNGTLTLLGPRARYARAEALSADGGLVAGQGRSDGDGSYFSFVAPAGRDMRRNDWLEPLRAAVPDPEVKIGMEALSRDGSRYTVSLKDSTGAPRSVVVSPELTEWVNGLDDGSRVRLYALSEDGRIGVGATLPDGAAASDATRAVVWANHGSQPLSAVYAVPADQHPASARYLSRRGATVAGWLADGRIYRASNLPGCPAWQVLGAAWAEQ